PALAQSLAEVLRDENERQRLSRAGLERAAQFTWEQTARLTLDVYEEVLRVADRAVRAGSADVPSA
ncbi:MAG: hypothetical protein ACR2GW_08750, partial [Pyrinomonadaceae bacterium]